jgi:polyphenol oxidase
MPEDQVRTWQLKQSAGLDYFELLSGRARGIFTGRAGGVSEGNWQSLNLSSDVGDNPVHVRENRTRLQRLLGSRSLITLRQTHSTIVHHISNPGMATDALEGDALFTDFRNVALGVVVADCLPIYLVADGGQVIGLAHAGWRGTLGRIAVQTSEAMCRQYGISPDSLSYALGPCIGRDCYEIGPEVASLFRSEFPMSDEFLSTQRETGNTKCRLDLKAANRQMLRQTGLKEIAELHLCTLCQPDDMFSARRDRVTGRNMAILLLE